MQKYCYTTLYLLCGMLFLWSGISADAQYGNMGDFQHERSYYAPTKKHPSIFRRPKKSTSAEQLEYAKSLVESDKLKKAGKQYNNLVHKWHESPEAPQAQYAYANTLNKRGKYLKAFREYQYLMDNFQGRFTHDTVLKEQFKVANHVMNTKRFKLLFLPGLSSPDTAVEFFEKIVKNAPTWENAPKAQFNIGLIEEQRKRYEDAAMAYGIVQNRYRDSNYAATAFYRRAYCLYQAARKRPKDERRNRDALSALAAFIQRYNSDPNEKEARIMMKELKEKLAKMYYDRAYFYDKMQTKPLAALIMYEDFVRKFPTSELTPKVNERIAELKQATAGMEN